MTKSANPDVQVKKGALRAERYGGVRRLTTLGIPAERAPDMLKREVLDRKPEASLPVNLHVKRYYFAWRSSADDRHSVPGAVIHEIQKIPDSLKYLIGNFCAKS